jgi:hypothetical protein
LDPVRAKQPDAKLVAHITRMTALGEIRVDARVRHLLALTAATGDEYDYEQNNAHEPLALALPV